MNNNDNSRIVIGKIASRFLDIVNALSWLGISGSALYSLISKNWWFVVISVVLFGVVALVRYVRTRPRKIAAWAMKCFSPTMPYMFTEWNVTYEYLDKNKMRFEAVYCVKPLQVGVDKIIIRFNWSGEGENNQIVPVAITESGFDTKCVRFLYTKFGYSYYEIYTKHQHNKGDACFKVGIRIQDLVATRREPLPRLMTNVGAVTDILRMKVILPQNMRPNEACADEYFHSTDFYHWTSEPLAPVLQEEKWVLNWPIETPIYGGKYVIQWEPNYSKTQDMEEAALSEIVTS